MDVWFWVAAAAAVFTALNIMPQLIKSFRTKKTDDLSYGTLAIIISGNILWTAHAAHRHDWALLISNVILLASAILLTLIKKRYDRH